MTEQNDLRPEDMREKKMDWYHIYRLNDGRELWEYQNGTLDDPTDWDLTVSDEIDTLTTEIYERGWASVYPHKYFVPKDGELVKLETPGLMTVFRNSIVSIADHCEISDLDEDGKRAVLESRARQAERAELSAMAEKVVAEEIEKNPNIHRFGLGVTPKESVKPLYIEKYAHPWLAETPDGQVVCALVVELLNGRQEVLAMSPQLAHQLGHDLLGGPTEHNH